VSQRLKKTKGECQRTCPLLTYTEKDMLVGVSKPVGETIMDTGDETKDENIENISARRHLCKNKKQIRGLTRYRV